MYEDDMTGKFFFSVAIDLKGSSFASIFIFLWHKLSRHSLSPHQVHLYEDDNIDVP